MPRRTGRWPRVKLVAALAVVIVSAAPLPADAHDAYEITADARVAEQRLVVTMTMSFGTALGLCFGSPRARAREPDEFARTRVEIEACMRRVLQISSGDDVLAAGLATAELTVEGDVETKLAYPRPQRTPLLFEAPILRTADPNLGILLTVTAVETFLGQTVLRPNETRFEIPITAQAEAVDASVRPGLLTVFLLGIRAVVGGLEHLLFVAGLLLLCDRLRQAVMVVASVVVAQFVAVVLGASAGLSAAVGSLPARIVLEATLATSVVVVGVANLVRAGGFAVRAAIALVFGLIHGIGLATTFGTIDLGVGVKGRIVGPLLAFGGGLGVAEMIIGAATFLVTAWLQSRQQVAARVVPAASAGIAVIGVVRFVQRLW